MSQFVNSYRFASAFNPLTAIPWHVAVWADDPDWTNPGDGGAMTTWRDGSGNSRTLSTSVGSPTFRASVAGLNNHAGVDFDGSDDEMEPTLFTTVAQTVTAVWIGTRDGAGGGANERLIDLTSGAAPSTSLFMRVGTGKFSLYGGSGFLDSSVSYTTAAHAARAKFAGASTAINVNGTNTTGSPGTGGCSSLTLGGAGAGVAGDRANVHVGFAGIYAGDVTAHGGWAGFVSWVSSYYGLTIA